MKFALPVLPENVAQRRHQIQTSPSYAMRVFKWRFHFYEKIVLVYRNAGYVEVPTTFAPLEHYLSGFTILYHDIADLPKDFLGNLLGEGEEEEGWHYLDYEKSKIHIFYDPRVLSRRQRFTLAHEWGHIFQMFDWEFKADMESIEDPYERHLIIESVADHFAGYYLVPKPIFKQRLELLLTSGEVEQLVPRLAEQFGVSGKVINICMNKYREKAYIKR